MTTQPAPETYLRLIRTLAEQGNPKAQYNLGAMLLHGQGLAKNVAEAAQWFLKAAKQGIPLAQHNLGVMLLQGEGVTANPIEAARWLLAAAQQGDPKAQHTLGALYFEGRGVEQDMGLACFWLGLARHRAPEALQAGMQTLLDHVAAYLPPDEWREIQQRVAHWQPQP